MSTWEERMAERARERRLKREEPAAYDPNRWRKGNVVFGRNGEILYPNPAAMPCRSCGLEITRGGAAEITDHPYEEGNEYEDVCVCGYHESYHRPHDCVKDELPNIACACSGGQPWFCCMNRYARQHQFVLQKLANVLRAAVEK